MIELLSRYLQLQVVFTVGAVAALSLAWANGRYRWLSFRRELTAHYCFLASLVAIVALSPWLPGLQPDFLPRARVWAAPSAKKFQGEYATAPRGALNVSWRNDKVVQAPSAVGHAGWWFFSLYLGLGLLFFLRQGRLAGRLLHTSIPWRTGRRVRIRFSGDTASPFSLSAFGRSWVIVPEGFLEDRKSLRIALKHEFEHLRRGDTTAVYALWAWQWLLIGNPLVKWWRTTLLELQEFACDETLIKRGVSAKAMGGCLLKVAQIQTTGNFLGNHSPVCAAGLCFPERSRLKRRILIMSKTSHTRGLKALAIWWLIGLSSAAFAATVSSNLVQDRRITMAEAQALKVASDKEFPVAVNELVVNELNRYVSTPDGRQFVRDSLARMKSLKKVVVDKMDVYQAPLELLAVPIVESGFQNLPEKDKPHGAGLWQFIRSTARHYGLRVDKEVDERLDVELLTDAAMRMLHAEKLRFKSWELALMAYNSGQGAVQKAIEKHKTRDAWELVRKGSEVYPGYLSKVIAMVLILKNPQLLD